ncbi:protein FAR-RED IMPAIRED RESPONSE 1-like, partial [Dorcoceras hygrometricum]
SVFGDVVVFDTTYNTNKYGMIFAPFVGVNHHHQTIVFGCGFLSDEKTESFVWLFNNFIESMPNGAPNVIITDQDPAITKAIAYVFPRTVHRFCLWHILSKFLDKLAPITFRVHYPSIKKVIENSTSPDEFEQSWKEVIKCANLENNDWLSLMYYMRQKWVPAYLNHVLCAGMSSSQRVDVRVDVQLANFLFMNSKKNTLMDFVIRFNRALRHQRHNELVADHVDINEHPKIKSNWPMERQMVKVYTRKKWLEFQRQMYESHGYYVQQKVVGDGCMVYDIISFQSSSISKPRVLSHNQHMDYISCSCMKFEFEGIPCRHMLAFFRINQVFKLPEKYILKRWTRDAKVGGHLLGQKNVGDNPEKCLMSRHSKLSYKAAMVIDNASLTDEGTDFLDKQLDYVLLKIKEINVSRSIDIGCQKNKSMEGVPTIIDPSEIRTKGCGKRLTSSKEKQVSKSRQCRGCGLRGVSHNKRNCPMLHDGYLSMVYMLVCF